MRTKKEKEIHKIKIEEGIYLEQIYSQYGGYLTINVLDDGKRTELISGATDYTDFSICTEKPYYIVNIAGFPRRSWHNCSEFRVNAAYDTNKHRLIDLSNDRIRESITHMFLSKSFSFEQVLQEINKVDLGVINDEQKNILHDYITSGNKNITHEQVVEFILMIWPQFSKYANIDHQLKVFEYIDIKHGFHNEYWLTAMLQDLSFLEEDLYKNEEQPKVLKKTK